ncbi:4-amino-4-deoxychorismate lyase [Halobacteriales archaeon SW_7_71_33]|nr:MAG: 4-amino-4-deoxychorismate lyase [Halobacteriales archaeon SW_7_71_33]
MSRDDLGDTTVVVVGDADASPSSLDATTPERARVSPLDRGFLYGDAAFETLRCYDGQPVLLSEHVDRLHETLSALSIPAAPSVERVRAWTDRLLDGLATETASDPTTGGYDGDAYVRLSVTRGERRGVLTPTETDPTLVGVAVPLSTRRYEPALVETADERRYDAALYRLKTHNYLPSVLARGESDADEVLMRDASGAVASGAGSNVFVLDGDALVTPEAPVRRDVTREAVRSVAADLGYATREARVRSVADADAVVLTNTTWGVRPVGSVDGHPLPVPDAVERLADRYLDRVLPD